MGNHAISVIVPAYNGEQTISACLRSLLSQTFSDFEIICFNDGSTDGTEAVIADFVSGHPEKIRSFRHENVGASGAKKTLRSSIFLMCQYWTNNLLSMTLKKKKCQHLGGHSHTG